MTAEEPRFSYERFGFRLAVYQNRVVIKQRRFWGDWTEDNLLMRSITNVGVRLGGRLQLTLADGGLREYSLGTKAEAARNAIVEILAQT